MGQYPYTLFRLTKTPVIARRALVYFDKIKLSPKEHREINMTISPDKFKQLDSQYREVIFSSEVTFETAGSQVKVKLI